MYVLRRTYLVPPMVRPDIGRTSIFPKLVAMCFSSAGVTVKPPLVAQMFPSCPQIAALDTV